MPGTMDSEKENQTAALKWNKIDLEGDKRNYIKIYVGAYEKVLPDRAVDCCRVVSLIHLRGLGNAGN